MPEDGTGGPGRGVAGDPGLRAWVEYLRDMGIHDLYRRDDPAFALTALAREQLRTRPASPAAALPAPSLHPPSAAQGATSSAPSVRTRQWTTQEPPRAGVGAPRGQAAPAGQRSAGIDPSQGGLPSRPPQTPAEPARSYFSDQEESTRPLPPELVAPMPKPTALESLFPQAAAVPAAQRADALERLRAEIGDCTRCPLAYAGRHTIVFGEGDPNAALMFVGEGPGADEDASGLPFVGKAGQLLNNMVGAMGLAREQVYIANIVKCRPPGNRTPEFVEATTCSPFLLQQIDIVQPKVIVALGATAATYLLGVRQSLASLRGQWFRCRDAKVAVTYHPAFLLRDPRQKAEAWKDLQRVMAELALRSPSRA